jgi:hypothetical protein
MKFIAPKDFSQGSGNPLKIAGGGTHIKMGSIFSIGDECVSVEQLGVEDLRTYRTFFSAGCLCPLDSNRGQHVLAEVERLRELEEKVMAEERQNDPANKWWKKPAGVITLVAIGGVVMAVLAVILVHSISK